MPNIEELEKYLENIILQNHRDNLYTEGYSSIEMLKIISETFVKDSPVELLQMTEEDYNAVPMLNEIKYLANLLAEEGEIKLTAKGYLPTKIVANLYKLGFIKEEMIESGFQKLYKESDSMSITLARILLELSGIAKKRNNRLSLTKKGEKARGNNPEMLRMILDAFCRKFNWGYFDGYGDNGVGQLGFGFTFILLSKFGQTKERTTFYAKKYFQTFPHLLDNPNFDRLENCYSIRTFDRFLDYFGLISIERGKTFLDPTYVSKSALFDKMIKCIPHK